MDRLQIVCTMLLIIAIFVENLASRESPLGCSMEGNTGATICMISVQCHGLFKYDDSSFSSIKCPNQTNTTNDRTYNLILNFYDIDLNIYLFKNFLPSYFSIDKVKVIRITNSELLSVPDEIFMCENINHIGIMKSTLEAVDFSRFRNQHIISINMSDNLITYLEQEYKLNNPINSLEIIDLSYNFIEIIPNNYFVFCPNLVHLNLSHNQINHLEKLSFGGLSRLKTVNLSHNKLLSLVNGLMPLENLQKLFLDHNKMNYLKEEDFNGMIQLQKLYLSSNNITSIEKTAFQMLQKLEILDLSNNPILCVTYEMFQNNTKLDFLILPVNSTLSTSKNSTLDDSEIDFYLSKDKIKIMSQFPNILNKMMLMFNSIKTFLSFLRLV